MKTLVLTAILATTLAGAGNALADAECQAGSAYGYKAGCGGHNTEREAAATEPPHMRHDPRFANIPRNNVIGNSGRSIDLSRRYYRDDRYQDRDGDGVPDRRDRRPRDSRRW